MPTTRKKPDTTEAKRASIRDEFRKAGVTLSAWAKAHGFARMTVVDVLRGHRVGLRGEAHRVAIALGLKTGQVVTDPKQFKPVKGK